MDKFWALLEQSVIVQGALALGFGGTVCGMYLTGKPVPQELITLMALILGYFFGAKNGLAQSTMAKILGDARFIAKE